MLNKMLNKTVFGSGCLGWLVDLSSVFTQGFPQMSFWRPGGSALSLLCPKLRVLGCEVQARLKTPELRDCLEARSCRNSISAGDAARTAVQEMCSSTRSEAGEAVVVAEVEVLEAPKSPAPDLLKVLELPMKGEADTFEPATEVTVQVTTPTESPPSRKEELAEVLHQMVATADANMQADHHFDSIQANCLELNRFNTDSVSARGAIIECLHHVTDVGKQESESEEGEAGTMANHPQVEQAALANTSEDHPPTREAEEAETHGITQDSQVPLEDVQLHREGGEDCPMGTMELVVQTPPEGPSEPSGRCGSKATCAHETSWDPRPEAKVETGVAQGEADTHGTEGSAEESLDRTEACRWRARAEEEVAPEEQSLLDDLEELAKEVGAEDLEQGLADEMAIGEVKTEAGRVHRGANCWVSLGYGSHFFFFKCRGGIVLHPKPAIRLVP